MAVRVPSNFFAVIPWGTMDMAQMFSSVAKFGDKDIISVNGSASAPSIKC